MKATITKDMVADAIRQLTEKGQKATLQAIHAALGGKGSITTLVKLKGEIESQAQAPQDSEEGLKQFRALWAAAVAEGRKQMETQLAEMRAGLDAVSTENERLEAAAIADGQRVAEIMAQRDKLVDELSEANRAATEARAAGADAAGRLASALGEVAQIRGDYVQAITKNAAEISAAKDVAHQLALAKATLEERLAGAERARSHAEAIAGRLERERNDAWAKIEKLEGIGLERDRLAADLEAARREIKRLTPPAKPRTPKA